MVARGLRQGNPLSPYLFLICAECLSASIRESVEQGALKGIAAYARGPAISHLFFVDDSLIFCRATKENCSTLLTILEKYETASS